LEHEGSVKQAGIRMNSSPTRPSGWPEVKFYVN
jgi:hypothetical protein